MRTVLVIALLVPLAAAAGGASAKGLAPRDALDDSPFGGKSAAQIHSPILVYHQPFRMKAPVQARGADSKKKSGGATLSAPLGAAGADSSGGASSVRSPPRTAPRERQATDAGAPGYGGPSDPRAATMDNNEARSTDPCRRSGYHDNVMSHGLDTARTTCELHQLDKNRWQLWALSGGDPLLHKTMERQLDKGLDLFGVPK